MNIPDFIKKGDIIGVTAPSAGFTEQVDLTKLENAKFNLSEKGYEVIETCNVRKCEKGRSSTGKKRAEEFLSLIRNEEVKYILSASGGDFLMEMLEYQDYELIKANPKWIQGYSDNTGLIYPITTICDMATVYSGNVGDYGMSLWHDGVKNNLKLLEGKNIEQKEFDLFENEYVKKVTGYEGYNLTDKVKYEFVSENKSESFTGRLLGGCLDVLIMLCGTKYDKTEEFVRKYKEDGIIWYLESFDLSSARIQCALWQLKEAGWFEGAKGFLFGRPCFFREEYETDFNEAVKTALDSINLPIITGCDIGHRPPRLTMINGLVAEISFDGEHFKMKYPELC
ncbi:LD-carboxypeptidase [Catonella morbi ATCC 51271]|uniref:LD-carboxypeptidase n=1 Tax=Catonella morbi ATCC 51271 TaxID=592026 RepID=V2Y1I2_9FIRM|nr:S66 peptidase family protein [Catonella morbi]ESL02828.1 LD-carboxypeptidase [Catonella morbi ATCC 51271]